LDAAKAHARELFQTRRSLTWVGQQLRGLVHVESRMDARTVLALGRRSLKVGFPGRPQRSSFCPQQVKVPNSQGRHKALVVDDELCPPGCMESVCTAGSRPVSGDGLEGGRSK
jgi:hypothetical protein